MIFLAGVRDCALSSSVEVKARGLTKHAGCRDNTELYGNDGWGRDERVPFHINQGSLLKLTCCV